MSFEFLAPDNLSRWVERLADAPRSTCELRRIEADLHREISGEVVRKARVIPSRIPENDLPHDASALYKQVDHLNDVVIPPPEEWVEEVHERHDSYVDKAGEIVLGPVRMGYENSSGAFVEKPDLRPVPHYLEQFEAAVRFKHTFLGSTLKVTVEEIDGSDYWEYEARIAASDGKVFGTARGEAAAHAVVAATLVALIARVST